MSIGFATIAIGAVTVAPRCSTLSDGAATTYTSGRSVADDTAVSTSSAASDIVGEVSLTAITIVVITVVEGAGTLSDLTTTAVTARCAISY